MTLQYALELVGRSRGEVFAIEIGWKKLPSDCTGYGQFVLVCWPGEVYKWVAWYPKENRFTIGGVLSLQYSHFEKNWEVVDIEELKRRAVECLNPLEKENLRYSQGRSGNERMHS